MTDTPCLVCGAAQSSDPAPGCRACAGIMRAKLHGVPSLLGLLADAVAKVDRVDPRRELVRSAEHPEDRDAAGRLLPGTAASVAAPIDLDAVRAREDVLDALALVYGPVLAAVAPPCGHWSCDVAEGPLKGPRCPAQARHLEAFTAPAVEWLADQVDVARRLEDFPELLNRLRRATGRGWALVDQPPGLGWFAGECDAELEDDEVPGTTVLCGRKLYARLDEGTVRCPACRTVHDVTLRRRRLLDAAEDVLMTATEAARALTALEHPVTPERVRKWKSREQLAVSGYTLEGRPRYRLGDVLALLRRERYGITSPIEGKAS